MQSQHRNDTGPSFQDVALCTIPIISSFLLTSYLRRSKKISSKVKEYSLHSKNTKPEISAAGSSLFLRFPKNTKRKTLAGFGPKTQVSEIEIEIWDQAADEADRTERRQCTLTGDYPIRRLTIIPQKTYFYRWRSRENFLSWSEWSEHDSFRSEPVPFRVLPGSASKKRCSQLIKALEGGNPVNILLVGQPGAGKSAFINRLATAISGHSKFSARTKRGSRTTTQRMIRHGPLLGKVSIFDMPGWEKDFVIDNLPRVIRGELEEVTPARLRETAGSNDANHARQTSGNEMPRIDVVLFFIAENTLGVDKDEKLHQELLDVLNTTETPCIGILSQVDIIGEGDDWPVSNERFYEDPRVIARSKQVPSLDIIFPSANPPMNWAPTLDGDELMLQIVLTAQELKEADSDQL